MSLEPMETARELERLAKGNPTMMALAQLMQSHLRQYEAGARKTSLATMLEQLRKIYAILEPITNNSLKALSATNESDLDIYTARLVEAWKEYKRP